MATLAIDSDGNLWAWGSNNYGQLFTRDTNTYYVPTHVMQGTKFKSVKCSGTVGAAIDTSGNLWVCGDNSDGQLGIGSTSSYITTPTKVKAGTTFTKVSTLGNGTMFAIDSSGKLWGWGNGATGRLGNRLETNSLTPIQIQSGTTFKEIGGGGVWVAAIDTSGNIWSWGQGMLGNGTNLGGADTPSAPVKISSGTNFVKIYTVGITTLAIDNNGNIWGWGENDNYGFGVDNRGLQYNTLTKVISGKNFKDISMSINNVLLLDNNGKLWGMGLNGGYDLGTGNQLDVTTPTMLNSERTYIDISTSSGSVSIGTSYAIDSQGDLWATGSYALMGNGIESSSNKATGLWRRITTTEYTVTLNTNGGTINSGNIRSYKAGTGATLPTSVTKTGYTFGGWYDNSACTGSRVTSISSTETGNKTYWAKWTANTYRVTLNKNGGTINSGDITEYTYGTTTNLPTNVTKTGYTFGGWYDNSSFSGSRIISIGSTETGNKTYYAKWTPNTYTVTLNANGGTINSGNVTSYTYGTTTTLPTNVTKTGNTFGGWYDNSSLSGTAVTVIGATETGNKTYWAKWNANNHTVVFMNGTEEVKRQEVSHGGAATAPSLTKEGYTLSWDKAFNNITGDLTVNAVWTVNKHTVTFKDGEEIAKTEQVNHGTGATAPSLTKDGYVLRWDKTFNNVTSDITVNAVWLKDTDKDGIPDIEDTDTQVRYTVLHYKQNVAQNGYEEPEKEETTGNLGTTVTATPKTYAGFSENQTTTERIPSGTVVDDGSLTLKLYYDRNTYTITLNPNGGTINDTNYMTEYTYGIGGNLPTNVTKEGYTFGGWYDNANLTGNAISQVTASDLNNKTYYASWNANGNTAYKVLHYKQTENGYTLAETEELTGQTGANVTALPKTYEGYVENTTVPERIPSGTITADGSLELKLYYDMLTYQVTFKDGDTVLNTQTVSYGTSAVEPTPAPTKEGYVLRWDKEYNNVISNLTVNTVWLRDTDGDGIPDIEDPETLVEYVVKHYKQQGNTNTYELVEEEKLQGQLGSVVNAIPKAYVGYAENTEATERRPSGTITSDEKLELILLYYRLKYTVTFKDGDEVVSVVEVLHGEEATPPNLTKPGYTLSWDKALDNITGEQTINAVWTKLPEEKREYKVEHYVETKEGGYSLKETDKLVGDIGDVVLAVPKTYNEYELNEKHEGAIREGEIKEDSELILKLYYKYKRFTVIFKDGNDIVKEEEVIYGGTATPPNLTKPGYILSWNKVLDDITKEQTITAVWTKDPNYKDPNAGKDDGKEEKPSILPKTGEETVTLGAIMGLLGIAVVYFVKYKS